MKIAVIGTGNLGLSIAKGLIINNTHTTLYLTKRNLDSIESMKEYKNVFITKDNNEAVKNSDILILAVQPNQLDNVLENISPDLKENHIVISTVTGYTLKRVEEIIGNKLPIIRSMPNTAISVRKSMTCLCSNIKGKKVLASQCPACNHKYKDDSQLCPECGSSRPMVNES